ncbi:MAG: hypothetical protein OEY10_00325 [Nitrosopumilus sp.]|nr:hypothetical protein [Nitrosopumilus sp.]
MSESTGSKLRLPSDKLEALSNYVNEYRKQKAVLDTLESRVTETKNKLNELVCDTIPELMQELGLSRIDLDGGTSVIVKDMILAHIKKENQAAAHAWLNENGFGDIIKNEFLIKFGKDDKANANAFKNYINSAEWFFNAKVTNKEVVHPQTLKAVVNEQINDGNIAFLNSDAADLLGIIQLKTAVIK